MAYLPQKRMASWHCGIFGGCAGCCKSTSAQKLLHLVVIAHHEEEKTFRTVLKNQPNVQSDPDFEERAGKLANSQTVMPMGMPEILLQLPERASNFTAQFPRIIPDLGAERPAQFERFQSARSFSRLPVKCLLLPRLRSARIFFSIRFSKRASSAGVAPYSRQA